jgi:potassium efflux system protein
MVMLTPFLASLSRLRSRKLRDLRMTSRYPASKAPASKLPGLSLSGAIRVLFGLVMLFAAGAAFAQVAEPAKEPRAQIEAGRLEIGLIEAALQRETLDDSRLAELRARVDPVIAAIEALILREQPRAAEVKARIDKLGPAPDASKGQSESADVAKDRAEQQRIWKEMDETLRLAQALMLRAGQVKEAVADRRLRNFARETLRQGDSIASPGLWYRVVTGLPADLRAFKLLVAQWGETIAGNLDWYEIVVLVLLIGLLGYSAPRAWRWVQSGSFSRRHAGVPPEEIAGFQPPTLAKALVAIRMVLLSAVVPIAVLMLFQFLLHHFGLVPARAEVIVDKLVAALAMVITVGGLALGVFAPNDPEMRLFAISTHKAREFWRLTRLVALLAASGAVLGAVLNAIVASLPLTIAVKGVFAVLVAFTLMRGMRRVFNDEVRESDPEPGVGWLLPVRLGCWAAALVIFGAALTGFVALADFLVGQVIWISALTLVTALALVLIEEFLGVGLSAKGAFGRRVQQATGLAPRSLDQLGVLGAGVARLALYVIVGFLLLAPWGVDSSNVFGTVRAAFFGFQVGGVTISLSTIVFALGFFVFGYLATRAIKAWLEGSYLPHTGLDIGLRNSIGTIFGYIGTITAAMVALAQLGFSVEKLTLVAGALSVGIGFGLQSIVNNFVSGLILLWERPIRVGDYIVVGEEQGTVKRINVRSTEIETFDRASLIIPNAEFISGRVKNWMHADRIARVIIPVNVEYEADPHQVQALLLEAALAHREVMSEPKPFVMFKNLGESGLDFELFVYVDVDSRGNTRSELLFDIFSRLKEAKIGIPYPTRRLEITSIDGAGERLVSAAKMSEKR